MSDKVRVFEIAEEAASTSAEVMQKAKELGIDLKTAQATVSYEDAEEITQYIMTGKSSRIKEPVEEKVLKPKKEIEVKEETQEVKALETNNKEQVISNSIKTEITKPAIAKPILKTEENVTILNDEDNIINPTKVVPKRKGLVIIKKKRPEEQEVKVVKEDFEVKKTQKSLSDIFGENERLFDRKITKTN